MGGVAYLVQDWSYLQITFSVLTLLLSGLWFFLQESPRWLIAKGRRERALKVLKFGAKRNGKRLSEELLAKTTVDEEHQDVERLGVLSLFSR